jgi:hypothetical protein
MIWLTWRQLRIQAVAVYAAVAAALVLLAVTGPRLVRLARLDGSLFDRLTPGDRNLFYAGIVVLAIVPPLIGAFWGAPMVARELEAGTHRLAWSQSVSRTRWLATKLGVTVLAAAAAVGLLTLAIGWWAAPLDGARSTTRGGLPARLSPIPFAMRGVVPVGYVVFAVVLGVALGMVLRRTLPAMALTLGVVVFAQLAVPQWVRPHLIPPAQQTVSFTGAKLDSISLNGPDEPVVVTLAVGAPGDWILKNESVDAAGRPVAMPAWMSNCLPPPPGPGAPTRQEAGPGKVDTIQACLARLSTEGYSQHVAYQPASRFWPLQWAELAFYLVLAGLLTGFCFWWTRRLS